MSKFAWVTLTTNDTYSLGALVLANSLRRVLTAHQLAVLVTPGVSDAMKNRLKEAFNVVQEVNVLDSQDAANLALLARPELGITFTKLHCWRLVQFEKCVFLDADTLILQNCDELFEREELSAAPDVSWPDCFNSGVFVYTPNVDTFAKLMQFAVEHGSFDGGDQGLLNQYFSEWATKDINKHLPFTYNTAAFASYVYLPAFKQFRDRIKILHFAGKLKPWLVTFNSQSKTAQTPQGYEHAAEFIQLWWNIFCESVHQNLNKEMNNSPLRIYEENYIIIDDFVKTPIIFYDPWDEYYEKLENYQVEYENVSYKNNSSNNTSNSNQNNEIVKFSKDYEIYHEPSIVVEEYYIESTSNESFHNININNNENNTKIENNQLILHNPQVLTEHIEEISYKSIHNDKEINPSNNFVTEHKHSEQIIDDELNNQNPYSTVVLSESDIATDNEGGLAGALSSLRLGEDKSPEQEAYEQLMRRQCWETGNIDYTGKDSFDNIWKKISQTLDSKPKSDQPEPATQLHSAEIEDGKIEFDKKTNSTIVYKVIPGGWTKTITTPQPNGTKSTQTKTFYDPVPVVDDDDENDGIRRLNTKKTQQDKSKTVAKNDNTTVTHRKIPNGREEIYTTIMPDGTKSIQVKTFYDSVQEQVTEETRQVTQHNPKKKITEIRQNSQDQLQQQHRQVQKIDKNDVRKQSVQEYDYKSEKTVEETKKVTQKTQVSSGRRVSKTDSIEERRLEDRRDYQTITTIDQQDGKRKKKSAAPPPPNLPPEFADGKTTVVSKKIPNGTEYTYTTVTKDGRSMTSSKTVYEEEEIEMSEEEIRQYQKQLKDAKKHQDLTSVKNIKTKDGSLKKIIPSENPGDVTTVEEKRIAGGTEYHYTTVTAEGIVKKSSKTVYDPVPVANKNDDDTEEEEIIEEYEEEIIEPGEQVTKTLVSNLSSRQESREIVETTKKVGQYVTVSEETTRTRRDGKRSIKN